MSLPIHIPEPCHQEWDGMQAQSQGRFCGACEKIVVDFSTWEPEQILDYLKSNSKTCGRFRAEQLSAQPAELATEFSWLQYINQSGLSQIGKLAATVFFLFVFASCGNGSGVTSNPNVIDTPVNQSIADSNSNTILQGEPNIMKGIDTLENILIGEVDEMPSPKVPKVKTLPNPEHYIVGDIAPPPEKEDTSVTTSSATEKLKEVPPMIMGAPMLKYNEIDKAQKTN